MPVAQNGVQALLHLLGRFAGKGHCQNMLRGNTFIQYKVGDSHGQGQGFTGAGPGDNQQGTVRMLYRPALLAI